MKKNKKEKNEGGIVYSTSNSFAFDKEEEFSNQETLPPAKQNLRVFIEKNHRGGKTVTIIKGFIGNNTNLEKLGKELKVKCGIGGSVKNGEIILQGEVKNKVLEYLLKKEYKVK